MKKFFSLFKPARRDKIVLNFSMGRVGSTAIKNSIEQYGVSKIIKVHYIQNKNNVRDLDFEQKLFHNYAYNWPSESGILKQPVVWRKSEKCYKLLKGKEDIYIITGVRDPISQLLSRFFFNLCKVDIDTYMKYHNCDINNLNQIRELFLREYEAGVTLDWFTKHFFDVTGIDVYSYDFPKEKGCLQIKKDNLKVLIVKLESDDREKEIAVGRFLGLKKFHLNKGNTIEDRLGDQIDMLYKKFKKEVKLPDTFLNNALNSKYTKHFYTEDEINKIYEKWKM